MENYCRERKDPGFTSPTHDLKKTDYNCVRHNYSLDENSTRLILKNHRLHQSPTMIG
jgi:hypothetical protein